VITSYKFTEKNILVYNVFRGQYLYERRSMFVEA